MRVRFAQAYTLSQSICTAMTVGGRAMYVKVPSVAPENRVENWKFLPVTWTHDALWQEASLNYVYTIQS